MHLRTLFITLLCAATLHAQHIATRSLTLDANLLNLPVCNGAPKQMVKLEVGGKAVREVEIELLPGGLSVMRSAEFGMRDQDKSINGA